ncbi:kelch domain-containing protein 3-like isoform X1 [Amphibalanus amphitrite]|uniref:kelch domain-containing protein 3-like isoform X1 n=2 Tax=Amphibalanus amphitrite TaxID=1232801 RepID=UPI001C8FB343|nr:kelch domain-containing protein 3-like isoform X1 [Amphibalanus amphitrite]
METECRSARGVLAMSHWTAMVEGGPVRVNHAAVVIEDTILSFGGYCAAEFDPHNPDKAMDIHAFSTETLQWTKQPVPEYRADHPSSPPFLRYGHTATEYAGAAYIFGGRNEASVCNRLYRYDPYVDKWSRIAHGGMIPNARDGHAATRHGHCLYVHGGYDNDMEEFSRDLFRYDFREGVWHACALCDRWEGMHRDFHALSTVGDKLYLFGGKSDELEPYYSNRPVYDNHLYVYDPAAERWDRREAKGEAPGGRRSHSAFVIDGKLYTFGGLNCLAGEHYNTVHRYDPAQNRWRLLRPHGRPPPVRRRAVACVHNGKAYIFGGTSPLIGSPMPAKSPAEEEDEPPLVDHSDLHVLEICPPLRTLAMNQVMRSKVPIRPLPLAIRREVDHLRRSQSIFVRQRYGAQRPPLSDRHQ